MALGLGFGVQKPVRTGGFTLNSISGLAAWYKFNTLHTLDGNALEEWGDSSGNNRTLTNTGATNKRPTVESDGRIDWEDVSNSFMDIQKEYAIAIVPTIIVFDEGEEVKRFQADLSFEMVATRKEIQNYIDELIMSKF